MKNEIPTTIMARFKKVAPNWAKYVESQQTPLLELIFPIEFHARGKRWSMDDCNLCIVGEAHGRTSDYLLNCRVCDWFCFDLLKIHRADWDRTLEKFLTHFEANHQ